MTYFQDKPRVWKKSCWLHSVMKGTLHVLSLLQLHVATVGLFTPSFWQPVCLDFLHQALRLVLLHLWYKQHWAILLVIWTVLNSQVTGMTNQMMVNVITVFARAHIKRWLDWLTDDLRNPMYRRESVENVEHYMHYFTLSLAKCAVFGEEPKIL